MNQRRVHSDTISSIEGVSVGSAMRRAVFLKHQLMSREAREWQWLPRGPARLFGRRAFGFGCQVFQNFSVGAGEGETAQLIHRTPAAGVNCPGQSIGKFGAKDFQRYPIARDGMADPKQRFEGIRAGAEEPFSELTNVAMIEGNFDIRKLPQVRVDDTGGAVGNGEAPATFRHATAKPGFSTGR